MLYCVVFRVDMLLLPPAFFFYPVGRLLLELRKNLWNFFFFCRGGKMLSLCPQVLKTFDHGKNICTWSNFKAGIVRIDWELFFESFCCCYYYRKLIVKIDKNGIIVTFKIWLNKMVVSAKTTKLSSSFILCLEDRKIPSLFAGLGDLVNKT